MTMIWNERRGPLRGEGWTKLRADPPPVRPHQLQQSAVSLLNGVGQCGAAHLVRMLDVDAEAQLLQHSALCFDDLVFGIYVVLIKNQ